MQIRNRLDCTVFMCRQYWVAVSPHEGSRRLLSLCPTTAPNVDFCECFMGSELSIIVTYVHIHVHFQLRARAFVQVKLSIMMQ